MSNIELDENDEVWNLKKKEYETDTEFNFRKQIYDNVYNDTKSKQKATLYSNIWVNMLSMECKYPDELMEKVEKYKPETNIYNVK
jgi:hypothetical protein